MKPEKQSLYMLGKEYEKHIELQKFFIKRCREDIKRAKELGDGKTALKLEAELGKFYEMKRELTASSEKLKNYYGKGEENDSI